MNKIWISISILFHIIQIIKLEINTLTPILMDIL